MNSVHVANDPGFDPFLDEASALVGVAVVAHLGDHLSLRRGGAQFARLGDRVRKRLLDVGVLAHLDRHHRGREVHVVGCRNHNTVDLVLHLLEHLAEIAVAGRHGELLGDLPGAVEVHVAQGHDLLANVGAGVDVALAFSTDADARNAHLFAGGR